MYFKFAIASGFFYLSFYAILLLDSRYLVPYVVANVANVDAFKLVLSLIAPFSFIYLFAAYCRYESLIDLANFWRYFWLAPCCIMNLMGPNPLLFAYYLLMADVFFGSYFLVFHGREIPLMFSRLVKHYSAVKHYPSQRLLSVIGYFGFVYFLALLIYHEGAMKAFTITITAGYYLFFEWCAKSGEDVQVVVFSLLVQFFILTNLLIDWSSYVFSHDIGMDYMIAYASIASLMHFYSVAWEFFGAMQNCGVWALQCALVNVLVSIAWVMASPFFAENPQKIALTQHRFDLMLSLFVVLVVFLMDKVKSTDKLAAEFITWFLPFELLWYSSQVKIMINYNFGSPYHPSWVARGLVKDYYSFNDAADLTYGIATVLMTVIATFSGVIVVIKNIHFKGWGQLSANGILLITFSALYMLAAVTGPFPKMVSTGFMSLIEVKPFIPLQPSQLEHAINTHVRDLLLGMMCLMGGLGLDMYTRILKEKTKSTEEVTEEEKKKAKEEIELRNQAIFAVISVTWILFFAPKFYLHLGDFPLV